MQPTIRAPSGRSLRKDGEEPAREGERGDEGVPACPSLRAQAERRIVCVWLHSMSQSTAAWHVSERQNALGARDVAGLVALDCFPDSEGQGLEGCLRSTRRAGRRVSDEVCSGCRLGRHSHRWWSFSPRRTSTCRVTPAACANDWKTCGIISVERSPIFSRFSWRSPQKYGRDEMSRTARARAFARV